MALCVGLFGTCGGSTWRDQFIQAYNSRDIPYFNPQVDDWQPELAAIEAEHLAEDAVILFPVTSETYGIGSLTETGFSVLQAIKLNAHRDFVVMIDQELDPSQGNPALRKESLRARALVAQHLKRVQVANLYIVDNLDDMLALSLTLFEIALMRARCEQYRSSTT